MYINFISDGGRWTVYVYLRKHYAGHEEEEDNALTTLDPKLMEGWRWWWWWKKERKKERERERERESM